MIKQDVYDEVQGLEPLCQEICHTLWNHPELSGNERESANFLRKILSEEGFTIENNEHLEHAFIAEYGKGKPVIAILGEYDALPGLSQKADIKKEMVLYNDLNFYENEIEIKSKYSYVADNPLF